VEKKGLKQRDDVVTVLDDLNHTLQYMAQTGCKGFECSPGCLDLLQRWGQPARESPLAMTEIQADVRDCRRCSLAKTRTNIVFGEGDVGARLVFVGEGPGYEEDQQGRPFVGAAGKLLTKIIQAMHLARNQVYICNIIKCRPPQNRNPEPEEIEACLPFLLRQLRSINPDFICALGTFAAQTLLKTTAPISRLRGRFHELSGMKIMPTYHPAYLLRNPQKKRDVWEDMQKLMKELGI
jgi:DNA polymerase